MNLRDMGGNMKCYKCGGSYEAKQGLLPISDEYVGVFSVEGVHYYECSRCNELLFPLETSKAIENRRNEIKDELIRRQPIDDFISAAEAAALLGITRQALHKHRRIRRGFIYQTEVSGNRVYLKQSVMYFKVSGDGRFPLYNSDQSVNIGFYRDTLTTDASLLPYVNPPENTLVLSRNLSVKEHATIKEVIYAEQ
jgi:hypothetical protein